MAEPDPSPNVPESWMTAGVGAGNSDEAAATPGKLPAKDTARLDMAHKIRHSNYNSIWEQQKHFTWLISIIFSGQAIILASTKLNSADKLSVLCIGSLLGMITSIIAFRVQRIEGRYFCQANEVYAEEYRAIYPYAEAPHRTREPNKAISSLVVSVFSGAAGVRDHFQVLFLAFATVFFAIFIYSCVAI